jgi:putative NADH-flavin reductase
MNIAVMGASGRTGRKFVSQAIAAGHHINGGAREPHHLEPNSGLTPITCDTTNLAEVRTLIKGADAVVSLIGHVRHSAPDLQTVSTLNALRAMAEIGVTRFISLTGTGVRFPGDQITLIDRILNLSITLIDPARIKDGRDHVDVIKASNLDWTIVRVLKLQNTRPTPFKLTSHGPTKWYVSRDEVVRAILDELTSPAFNREAPMISHV